MTARTDAPRNIQELRAFNTKHAAGLTEHQMQQVDRRWRSIGKMANQPAGLFNVKNYN